MNDILIFIMLAIAALSTYGAWYSTNRGLATPAFLFYFAAMLSLVSAVYWNLK